MQVQEVLLQTWNFLWLQRSTIPNRVDISEPPPKIIEKKERIGDWEADTIVGRRGGDKTCLLTLVDRRSKYTFIRKIKDKSAASVQEAIERIYSETTVPFITITPDNGTEFSNHQEIAENIGCKFFFARPYIYTRKYLGGFLWLDFAI